MLAFKLTPAAVDSALNVMSPEGKSTLVLRNRRIVYIENLEYTKNAFQVIDLTNNDIGELSGILRLPSLEVLLLGNNNISRVGHIEECAIKSLLLMNNSLSTFAEVSKLRSLTHLEHLILIGNKINMEHHYRLFVLWLLPNLKVLDCQKVKQAEIVAANELFGPNFETRSPAADALLSGTNALEPAQEPVLKETRLMETTMKKLLAEDKAVLVAELEKATSMEEIERISLQLKQGYVESTGV